MHRFAIAALGLAALAAGFQGGRRSDEPTYSRDIAPVFAKKCTPCHTADGPGPFPLETYSQVKNRNTLIRYILFSRKMPPLSGQSDMGHVRTIEPLTDKELRRYQDWLQADSPQGEEIKAPAKPEPWPLGKPDLILKGGAGETIAAEGAPYSKEIRLKTGIPEGFKVRAIGFRPKTPKSWRRALVFRSYPTEEKKSVWNPLGLPAGRMIGGWSLGAFPWQLPAGSAVEVKAGEDVSVVPIWQPSGKPENGEFEVGLYLDKEETRSPEWLTMGRAEFRIPPQDGFTELTDTTVLRDDVDLVSVLPEARLYGRMVRLVATFPSGEQHVAFMVRNWDWEWAGSYNFEKPIRLPKGTRLEVTITYDNSGHSLGNERLDPSMLRFGPTLNDELFWCHLQFLPVKS